MTGPAPGHGNGYPPSGNVPLFPAKAAGLPAAFFDAPEYVKGKGDLFEKRSPFPPHTPPIFPKTFMQVCGRPSCRTGPSAFPGPPVTCRKIWMEEPGILTIAEGLRMAGILPALPLPVSSLDVPAGCRKTDALFKRRTILYKIRLLSCLFAKRGTIAGPPDNGGDRPYRPEQKFYGGMGVRGKGDAFPKASLFPRPCLSRGPIPCPCS